MKNCTHIKICHIILRITAEEFMCDILQVKNNLVTALWWPTYGMATGFLNYTKLFSFSLVLLVISRYRVRAFLPQDDNRMTRPILCLIGYYSGKVGEV